MAAPFAEAYRAEESVRRREMLRVDTSKIRVPRWAIDKKLIVDLMAFAYQHERHRIDCFAVLITSDGDYCYSLSRVRQLGVKTVVIGHSFWKEDFEDSHATNPS